jgi:uncharacterized protein YodC (DUF2158 family)
MIEPTVTDAPPAIGWNSDPTGRYPLRWFDGDGWSSEVFDGDQVVTDRYAPPGLSFSRIPGMFLFLLPGLILALMLTLAIKGQ